MPKAYFIVFGVALLVSLVMTPVSIYLARRLGAMDPVDPRKVHQKEMPRWGGIAIVVGFVAALASVCWSHPSVIKILSFSQGIVHKKKTLFTLNMGEQLAGILAGALLLFGVGLIDDKKPVVPVVKLLVQILAAYIAMIYGVRIFGLSIPGLEAYSQFPLWMMQIITVLWLVGMTNAINLIDGLDGLAVGVIVIVAGSFLSVALLQQKGLTLLYSHQIKLAGLISAALMGGALAFLLFNFHPAKVFMGDCGSLPAGFLLGCIAITGAFKTTTMAVLFIPFLLVAIPVTDMTVAFIRRIVNKQNPFTADKNHFHHYLLRQGWTQREVVLLVYSVTMVLSLISFVIVAIKNR